MNMKFCAAGFCAAAIALAAFAAAPAEAAQKQKKAVAKKQVVVKSPPRARITVQRRSFLDAGTEVIPGDRKFTDYAIPPGYSPTAVIDHRAGGRIGGGALPGPFDLPGRQNPYPWHWCVGC
jgi:hypothetical protein